MFFFFCENKSTILTSNLNKKNLKNVVIFFVKRIYDITEVEIASNNQREFKATEILCTRLVIYKIFNGPELFMATGTCPEQLGF